MNAERPPKLAAVAYRLLEGEEAAVEAARNGEMHDFGGELVLTFDGGSKRFVSWVSEPVQYAIGIAGASHFRPDASLASFDVSDSVAAAISASVNVDTAMVAA